MFKLYIFILSLMLYSFMNVYANTQITTIKYMKNSINIKIDGVTKDWDQYDVEKLALNKYVSIDGENMMPLPSDFSASFMAISDNENLYVSVEVVDDVVCTNKNEFGWGWCNDSVEICFDGDRKNINKQYFDSNDGQLIVAIDDNNEIHFEGIVPYLYTAYIPFYWEARNINAAFTKNEHGYIVEISIPHEVLGWDNEIPARGMGLNVRIFDNDDNTSIRNYKGFLKWCDDPNWTTFWNTSAYNIIKFEEIENNEIIKLHSNKDIISKNKIAKSFNDYDDNDIFIFNECIKKMENRQFESAFYKLHEMSECKFKSIMNMVLLLHLMKIEEPIEIANNLIDDVDNFFIKDWIMSYPGIFAMELISADELGYLWENKMHYHAIEILSSCISLSLNKKESKEKLLMILPYLKTSDNDLKAIYNIMYNSVDEDIFVESLIKLAFYHCETGNYITSEYLCELILKKNISPEMRLKVETIVFSLNN